MTLAELSYTFFKAHVLMGTGFITGELIANSRGMSCSWLFGLLMGLSFSLRLYRKCRQAVQALSRGLRRSQCSANVR